MSRTTNRRSTLNSVRRRQSVLVSSDDAFTYALRTAYLHYLLQPRVRRPVPAPTPVPQVNRTSTSGSFHDLLKDFSHTSSNRDSKNTRFPKDYIPVLQKRIEKVWMGRETHVEYKDDKVKRAFASFYTHLAERRFNETVSKSRRPEELVIIFYSSATKELQKERPGQDPAEWRPLVDRHVALFVRLMSSTLKDNGWSSSHPELSTRLSTLEKKLLRNDGNLADDAQPSSSGTVLGPPEPLSYDVNDMPMVQQVSRVFNVPLDMCQEEIDAKKAVWTEKAALLDMKSYNNNLNLHLRGALQTNDFETDEGYETWKRQETPELSKVILAIIQSNPAELSKATAQPPARRPGHTHSVSTYSVSGLSSRLSMGSAPTLRMVADQDTENQSDDDDSDTSYVYIPPDPRIYFRHVIDRCLIYDRGDPELPLMDVPSAKGPVRLFSKASMALLDECCLRWRIPKFTRMVLILDCIRVKYEQDDAELVDIDGTFEYFNQEVGCDYQYWTVQDFDLFRTILSHVHGAVLRELYEMLMFAFEMKAVPIGRAMRVLEDHIFPHPLFQYQEPVEYLEHLETGLRSKAEEVLLGFLQELPTEREDLDPLIVVQLAQKVIKRAEKISKRFAKPIFNKVDPMMIFVEVAFPRFAIEAREIVLEIIKVYQEKGQDLDVEDAIELYKELSEIRRIFKECYPDRRFPVRFEDFLAEYVSKWLSTVDGKVIGWVDGAIKQDDFRLKIRETEGREPEDNERHTSSSVDIFKALNQPVDFLKRLEWQDEFQNAKFFTGLAKILEKGISRYCDVLEKLFTFEMDKPTAEQELQATQTRQQRWISLAREAWSTEHKIEPFQFAPECCVKLNNIEFAIQQFDKLERTVDSDAIASVINKYTPPNQHRGRASYVFTVKIIEAEDLKAMDMSGYSDPYVVLGDEYQKRLAKTRIVYRNLNPRWEESFDIITQGTVWLTATVWDWDTVGDHDCLGRTNIKLDPSAFMDFLPKELWLDLDIQGRLLVRISMEGERDDVQFHFGKAFRNLKRTERDMTRQITDKLSAYIHHCLSRQALKNVISKSQGGLSSVTSLFQRTSLQTRPQSMAVAISEADIAAAITPLTDYFNENFAILNQTLTSTAMTLVMSKLWKEVLVTLEQLMVPTLSDKPSQQRPLTRQETEIVFRWLQLMFDFFHAVDETTGQATGVPMDVLKSPKYHDLQSLNFFYFDSSESLIRESERMAAVAARRFQQSQQSPSPQNHLTPHPPGNFLSVGGGSFIKRSKSVLNKRNMGTMRQRKEDKRREAQAEPSDDMILRILRMRPEAAGYLKERSRQKERLEAAAAAQAIVNQSVNAGSGRMGPRR